MLMAIMNCFSGMIEQQKAFSLYPAGTIVRDLTSANLWHAASRIWTTRAQALMNEVVQYWQKYASVNEGV